MAARSIANVGIIKSLENPKLDSVIFLEKINILSFFVLFVCFSTLFDWIILSRSIQIAHVN